ncbi:hypothetical protein TURU_166777 [Turdus rufiventris]|nr:hypothetical protein TURU_166777 [Turdus rufiventris]
MCVDPKPHPSISSMYLHVRRSRKPHIPAAGDSGGTNCQAASNPGSLGITFDESSQKGLKVSHEPSPTALVQALQWSSLQKNPNAFLRFLRHPVEDSQAFPTTPPPAQVLASTLFVVPETLGAFRCVITVVLPQLLMGSALASSESGLDLALSDIGEVSGSLSQKTPLQPPHYPNPATQTQRI